MSTTSGSDFGSISMRTTRTGHTCNFTWTLRNVSQISETGRKHRVEFRLHPTCNEMWEVYALYPYPNELVVGCQPRHSPCAKIGPGSILGIYNTIGECYDTKMFSWSNPLREDLSVMLKKPEVEGKSIITENGEVFEILNDTLVIKGTVSVSFCCSRTDLYENL